MERGGGNKIDKVKAKEIERERKKRLKRVYIYILRRWKGEKERNGEKMKKSEGRRHKKRVSEIVREERK